MRGDLSWAYWYKFYEAETMEKETRPEDII